ncbi:HNH endonuclease [Nitrospira sp.]|nr:HNH endonuclease [Nitrospira sp.]
MRVGISGRRPAATALGRLSQVVEEGSICAICVICGSPFPNPESRTYSPIMPSSSPLDPDLRLRLAAFEALRRLTGEEGRVVSRGEMTAGFGFEGERIPLALRARGIWKPRQAEAALSITTAAPRPGVTPPYDDEVGGEGWFHYRYQGTDPDAADNRALRRARELGRPLVYFYGLEPGWYVPIWPVYVVEDRPAELTVLLAADVTGLGDARLLEGGSDAGPKEYATVTAKRRLHQARFRQLVVKAYQERCTVCRLHHPVLLDAAHILEDRDQRGLPEVPNGMALCKIHHGAYDANILGVDPDYRIHIRKDILDEIDGPMLRHGLQEMHGSLIQVPKRAVWRPRREYLEERFGRWKAA